MIRAWQYLIAFIFFFVAFSVATHPTCAQAMELGELFSRTTRYELQTKKILQDRLEAVIPKTHFILSVDAELFTFYNVEKPIENPDVFLGKLGLAEPIEKKRIEKYRIAKPNFFSNISALRVKLIVDESIPHSKIDDAQLIVHNMVPDINRQKIKFESGRMVVVEKSFWTRVENGFTFLAEWSARNRYALGLILLVTFASAASLLFYVFVKRSGKTLENLTHRFLGVIEKSIDRPTTIINSPDGMIAPAPGASLAPPQQLPQADEAIAWTQALPAEYRRELEVFAKVFADRPVKLASLLKRWLFQEERAETDWAMALLFELLPPEQLAAIMALLPDEDQQAWMKKRLDLKNLTQVQDAINFLQLETLQAGLFQLNEQGEDNALQSLILGLSNQEIVGCAKRDPALTAWILKSLPEPQIKAVFELMSKALSTQVIEKSLSFESQFPIKSYGAKVRQLIAQVRQDKASQIPTAFLSYLVEQLESASYMREKEIFQQFRDNGRQEVLSQLGKTVFPAQLILELPAEFLVRVLSLLSSSERTAWVASLDAQPREKIIRAYSTFIAATAGEELRASCLKLRSSLKEFKKVLKDQEVLWRQVTRQVRQELNRDELSKDQADYLVELWVNNQEFIKWDLIVA